MRKLLLILGILIFLDMCYFAYVNQGQLIILKYPPITDAFSMELGLFIISIGLYGALGAYLIMQYMKLQLNDKVKKQARVNEKAGIQTQESTDKVKVLEAKIATLEIALKEALSKK